MNGQFLQYVELGETLTAAILVTSSAGAPYTTSINPTYRIYGEGVLLTNGTGSLAKLDTFTVTAATNASPIAITTSAAHGLQTGNRVTIADVGGNTAANGTFTVTRTGATTFTLDGSTGNGAYTSGGAGHVTGLYSITHVCSGGNGFEAGKAYQILVNFTADAARADAHSIQVT